MNNVVEAGVTCTRLEEFLLSEERCARMHGVVFLCQSIWALAAAGANGRQFFFGVNILLCAFSVWCSFSDGLEGICILVLFPDPVTRSMGLSFRVTLNLFQCKGPISPLRASDLWN